ncbi:DUF3348 family protein [Paracidovorax wautersii]|uniref:DUF3348 domain-containing protein n=1 Tax=Paracidovorax wautersii TaxID=1177982 RepID=A0ABU1IFD6_9BURK|nr:DUF3348 family protein [Paracidovorax wautersii]MDR6215303.1 hypothetical protein [Paracidovorax wautersii]
MATRPERTSHLTGSTLVRLLAGLIDPQQRGRDTRMSFADALNQWTGWTESIALSKALDRPLTVGAAAPGPAGACGRHAEEQAELERVRAQQAQAIAREVAAAGRGPLESGMGFTPFRHCHQARQQAIESAVGPLRERVRLAVAQCPGEAARLAAIDAVMAEVLALQERRLLATVPAMLGRHFARLCEAGQAPDAAGAPDDADAEARRDLFRHDLQAVLLAELELRLQPVQGLLSALRPHQPLGGS